jgi:hypothetical protein
MKARLVGVFVCLVLAGCASMVGHKVVTPGTDTIVVEAQGGLGPQLPPGWTCEPKKGSFILSPRTHDLAWEQCVEGTMRAGKRRLGPDEVARLEGALVKLTVVRNTDIGCGTSSEWTPRVRVTAGGQDYADNVHACKPDEPVLDHDTLWDLRDVLVDLAHP